MSTYILIKDLPFALAGSKFTPENNNPDYYNTDFASFHDRIYKSRVEHNPSWFAKEEEPKRQIEVSVRDGDLWNGKVTVFQVGVCPPMNPYVLYPYKEKIKKVLGRILNNQDHGITYAETELRERERLAFEAGRKERFNLSPNPKNVYFEWVFPTFEDYLKTIKP